MDALRKRYEPSVGRYVARSGPNTIDLPAVYTSNSYVALADNYICVMSLVYYYVSNLA